MQQDYDFFLFSKMYSAKSKATLAYDVEFEYVTQAYEEFVKSKFNDQDENLYQCMEYFLNMLFTCDKYSLFLQYEEGIHEYLEKKGIDFIPASEGDVLSIQVYAPKGTYFDAYTYLFKLGQEFSKHKRFYCKD